MRAQKCPLYLDMHIQHFKSATNESLHTLLFLQLILRYPTCIAYLTITADYENPAEQDCWNTFISTKLFFFQLIFCLWHSSSGSCDDVFY